MARAAQVMADDVETEVEEPTLRETIEAARDEIVERQEADASEGAGEGGAAAEGSGGHVRDAQGRFVRQDAGAAGEGAEGAAQPAARAAQPADPATGAAASQGAAQPASPAAPELAPQGWTPAAKAKWAALPPDIRAEISRRETEVHRALTQQDEQRQLGRQFAEVTQAHQDIIGRSGMAPARFFADVLGAMRTLQGGDPGQKAMLIRDLIVRNQVDARLIFGQPQNSNASPQPQPANGQPQPVIPPQLLRVASEWDQFKQQQQREAQEREQREQQQTLDEIVSFRSKPEARFFDAVKDQMVALLQSGAARNLEEAYDQAIWTRPDIRTILQNEETQRQQAAELARARARNARAKGGSVRGGVGSAAPASTPDRSLREELQANFAEARGRI